MAGYKNGEVHIQEFSNQLYERYFLVPDNLVEAEWEAVERLRSYFMHLIFFVKQHQYEQVPSCLTFKDFVKQFQMQKQAASGDKALFQKEITLKTVVMLLKQMRSRDNDELLKDTLRELLLVFKKCELGQLFKGTIECFQNEAGWNDVRDIILEVTTDLQTSQSQKNLAASVLFNLAHARQSVVDFLTLNKLISDCAIQGTILNISSDLAQISPFNK